jgi:uncharacterized membrane protein YdjX (TVP38/TMEM64 family)
MRTNKQKLFVAAIMFTLLYWAFMGPSPAEFIDQTRQIVQGFGWYAPFVYAAAYVVISLTGFSVTVMNVAALTTFSPVVAFMVIVTASTIGAMIAFLIANRLFADRSGGKSKQSKTKDSVHTIVNRIEKEAERHPFRLIFGLRLLRLPYIALSYAAGLAANIPLKEFTLATLVSNMITAAFYVAVGTAVTNYAAIGLSAVAVVAGIVWLVRRTLSNQASKRSETP